MVSLQQEAQSQFHNLGLTATIPITSQTAATFNKRLNDNLYFGGIKTSSKKFQK
jgi:hypothetical protein